MKIICILITSLLVGACFPFFADPPFKSGIFMTDQEMSQHFIDNYDYFNYASELYHECPADYEVGVDKGALETRLDLLYMTCNLWPWSNDLRLVVYRQVGSASDARYIKGYFYSESPNVRSDEWNTNLNKIPSTHRCKYYHRHIRVVDDEYYNNWYIFTAINCD